MTPEELRRATAPGLTPQTGTGSGEPAGSSGGWNPFGSGTPKRTPTFVPEAAGGRGGYRVKDDNGNWVNLRPDELNQNGTNYSDGGQETEGMRNYLKGKTQDGIETTERARVAAADDAKYRLLQAQITQQGKASDAQIQSVIEQGKNAAGQLKLLSDRLGIEDGNTDADRIQRGNQFDSTMRAQTRQMELSNETQREKLRLENQQFERQHALDEKNGRRTQVMGALTLIAQSAAKF